MNESTRFKINPKSEYTGRDEGFDEKSFFTNRKKMLSLAGISAKIHKMVSKSSNDCLL